MIDGRENRDDFYVYGISRLSPRYWWRRPKHRIVFALLVLAVVASPFAAAIWGPSAKAWSLEKYHAYQGNRYSSSAAAFVKKGDLESARIQFQNALRHQPSNSDALVGNARCLRDLKQSGFALWAFQAHLLRPDDPRVATIALGYAMEEGQTEIAGFIVADSLRRHPKDPGLRILASHHFMRRGNRAAALRAAREARDIAPDNLEAAFLVASLSSQSPDAKTREQALAELRAFREKPAFRSRASWAMVNALGTTAPDAALAILDELAADDKNAWRARLRRIVISNRIEAPKTPAALSALWTEARDSSQRLSILETAELLAPAKAQSLLNTIGDAERRSLPFLLAQFRLWAREKDWRRIADLANESAQAHDDDGRVVLTLWMAKANRELKQNNAERTCVRVALARCESNPTLSLRAAMLLERLGMPDHATEFYDLAAAGAPGRIGAFATSRIAAIQRSAGDSAAMLDAWERALEKNPRDPQAMNNVATCLLLRGDDTRRALKLSSDALAASPGSIFFADTHALALAKVGRITEALAIHERLPKRRLSNAEFALNYATVLDLASRKAEAAAVVSNLTGVGLLPEQVLALQQITGGPPLKSLLLDVGKPPAGPTIPEAMARPIGPIPDGAETPDGAGAEFMPLPALDIPHKN